RSKAGRSVTSSCSEQTAGPGRTAGSWSGLRKRTEALGDLIDGGAPTFVDAPHLVDGERARPRDDKGRHDDVSSAADEIEPGDRVEHTALKPEEPDQNLGQLDQTDEQSDEH